MQNLNTQITSGHEMPISEIKHIPYEVAEALALILDSALIGLTSGKAWDSIRMLNKKFSALWQSAAHAGFAEAVLEQCRVHPVCNILREDPYTQRALDKPRGYAGDAVVMDFIYSGIPPQGTSRVGEAIFGATTRASPSLSVRYRRDLLRNTIDDTVAMVPQARILSVASGHARELDGSVIQSNIFDGDFIALDQDGLCCEEVQRSQNGYRVKVVNNNILQLLKGSSEVSGEFDLIYSAGLYDYIPINLCKKLTKHLYKMLRPGGRLLIGNFSPNTMHRGYMEVFMDWKLLYRDEHDMRGIAEHCTPDNSRTWLDPHGNVVYLQLSRNAI